ncbi:chemotaxis protein CheW [Lysobacter xanthus]
MATIDAYLDELLGAPVAHPEPEPMSAPVVAAPLAAPPMPTVEAPRAEPAPAPEPATALPRLSGFEPVASIAPIPRVPPAPTGRARTATGGNRWLRVGVGRDSYAFELLRVQEVVRVAPVVGMRGAAHAVLGVMNLRGRIVPVFDLGLWLDVGAVNADDQSRVVVIERDDELIGVLVTRVEDVVSLEREHVEPPLHGADPGPTLGVARVGDAPTVLLDADALFD